MSVCYFSFWHFNLSWRSIFFVMFNIALCSMFPYVVLYPEPKEVKFMNKRTNTFEPFKVVLSYMERKKSSKQQFIAYQNLFGMLRFIFAAELVRSHTPNRTAYTRNKSPDKI